MTFIYLSQFQEQPMITYQTQEKKKKKDYISVALSWKIPQQCFSSIRLADWHQNHCWASLVWKGSGPCCGECASFLGSQAARPLHTLVVGTLTPSLRALGMLGTWSFTAFWSQSKDWASCQGHKKICKWVQKSPRWASILCALFWVRNRGSTAGSVLTSH